MSKLLPPLDKGLCFVMSAPAGTGKTTLIYMLRKEYPAVKASVSFTTRSPRQGEEDGVDYHFISEKQFLEKIEQGDFLEYVKLYGYYYGTCRKSVEADISEGKHVFLVIDTQGARQLKSKINAIYIFLSPPSLEVLKTRLAKRKTETAEQQEARTLWAKQEMEALNEYDYHIVNDRLESAYKVLESILIAETHRIR